VSVTPNHPYTATPIGIRMGRGKGKVDSWAYRARAGEVLFEVDGMSLEECTKALKIASKKLPLSTELVYPEERMEWF